MHINLDLNWLLDDLKLDGKGVLIAGGKSELNKEEAQALQTLAEQRGNNFYEKRAFTNKGTASLHTSAKTVHWYQILSDIERNDLKKLSEKNNWTKILEQIK